MVGGLHGHMDLAHVSVEVAYNMVPGPVPVLLLCVKDKIVLGLIQQQENAINTLVKVFNLLYT